MCRWSSLRVAYLLLCLKSPQLYFNMPETDSIHLLNIAANTHQANRAFFKPMTEAVTRGWFLDKADPKQGMIQYAKNIEAVSGHSDAEGQEGLNLILGVADEIDAFRAKDEMPGQGKKSREASTSAESILEMLKTSASAQPLDARVLTPTGWKLMGDLRVGDRVVDPKGDATSEVREIFPQGVKPIFRLLFSDGSSAEATGDHLWAIEYRWIPTTDEALSGSMPTTLEKVVTTDWLIENLPEFQSMDQSVRLTPATLGTTNFWAGSLGMSPYLLGVLLGSGTLSRKSITFTSENYELLASCEDQIPVDMTRVTKVDHTGVTNVLLMKDTSLNNPLINELRKQSLLDIDPDAKFIPAAYKWSSVENRLALLQGLLDADGHIVPSGVEYSSESTQLVVDVVELAKSLDLSASIYYNDSSSNSVWKVHIESGLGVDLFRLPHKLGQHSVQKKSLTGYTLESIEYTRDAEAQCIAVTAQSQLYITNDFVVTHNTRFPVTYKRVAISYPRYLGSTIQRLTAEGRASNEKYGDKSIHYVSGPLATWDVNPRIEGKHQYQEDYDTDPIAAAAKYECKPTRSTDAYFRNKEIFTQAVDRDSQPLSVTYALNSFTSKHTGETTQGWEPVFHFDPSFQPIQGARYALHGDLAIKGDRAGIAMSHVEKWEERTEIIQDYEGVDIEETIVVPVIRNDFTFTFEADLTAHPSREIQIRWARVLAYELIKRGFSIASFTFDGYQSSDSMQILLSQGIESKRVSADINEDVWKTLKDVASDHRLHMPFSQLLMNELEGLSRSRGKIDHPPQGSKDAADAFACSIVGAIAAGGEEDADGSIVEIGSSLFQSGSISSELEGSQLVALAIGDPFGLPIGMKGWNAHVV